MVTSMAARKSDDVEELWNAPARHDGPQVLLCTEGSAEVRAKTGVEPSQVEDAGER